MKLRWLLSVPLFVSVCAAAPASDSPAAAIPPLGTIPLGSTLPAVVRVAGLPSTVLSTDVGHVFTWNNPRTGQLRLTFDDDGVVRMIDDLPIRDGAPKFTVPTDPPQVVAFGKLSEDQSDVQFSSLADFSGLGKFPDTGAEAAFRAYKLSPATELILLFDGQRILREAILGRRASLARSGLLPGAPEATGPRYSAPILTQQGSSEYPRTAREGDAILRIAVDKKGTVSNVTVVVSSGDTSLDDAAVAAAKQDVFTPARVDNIPVSAFVFHKEEFRILPPSH
ncbi:MAG: TonB family protein [Candidatus Eremiobacteraeota bacterium]|nr:TonB family protein [Candidatus Eremiobacteraeota bacterium]